MIALVWLASCGNDPEDRPDPTDDAPGETGTVPARALAIQAEVLAAPHALSIALSLDRAAEAIVTCTADGDPSEVHRVAAGRATEATVGVHGLLADTDYTCTATAADGLGSGETTGSARTPPLAAGVPEISVTVDRGDSDGAYILFNHWHIDTGDRVLVVDRAGRVRWVFEIPQDVLSDVDAGWYPEEQAFLIGGGSGWRPRYVFLDGTIGWTAPEIGDGWYHHHVERLPDGDVLALATATTDWMGQPFEGVQLRVYDPATDALVWDWQGQSALDAGELPPPPAVPDAEPWHANAVAFADDPEGPAAYVSFKWINRWVRIDRVSGAITWQLGPGADFALVDAAGAPLPDSEWFFGQHDPEYDPATGRLLVYDNGDGRPEANPAYSRVVEYTLDVPARTATRGWSWTEPGWFEPLYGDADRLPSGHVLIAMGHCACRELFLDHHSAIVEVNPSNDEVVWRLELGATGDGLYRADAIDGCDLFANQAYCPDR